jgi:hypothetical protein
MYVGFLCSEVVYHETFLIKSKRHEVNCPRLPQAFADDSRKRSAWNRTISDRDCSRPPVRRHHRSLPCRAICGLENRPPWAIPSTPKAVQKGLTMRPRRPRWRPRRPRWPQPAEVPLNNQWVPLRVRMHRGHSCASFQTLPRWKSTSMTPRPPWTASWSQVEAQRAPTRQSAPNCH